MGLVTIDPDAVNSAMYGFNSLRDDVAQHRARQIAHANQARYGLEELSRRSALAHEPLSLASMWSQLPFEMCAAGFRSGRSDVQDYLGRGQSIANTLVETHSGLVGNRLRDEMAPLTPGFYQIDDTLDAIIGWLSFYNIERLIMQPWAVISEFDAMTLAHDNVLSHLDITHSLLVGLAQCELAFVDLVTHPLSELMAAGLANGSQLVGLGQLAYGVFKGIGQLQKGAGALASESPSLLGPLVEVAVSFIAEKNHTGRTLLSVIYGSVIQNIIMDVLVASRFGPEAATAAAAAGITLGVITVGSFINEQVFSAWGKAQGGAWGHDLEQVSNNWSQTYVDSSAAGHFFTDVGALALDTHAGTFTVAAMTLGGPPELAPLVPSVYMMETAAGANPGNIGNDFGAIGGDLWSAINLPYDLNVSKQNTEMAFEGEGLRALSYHLPISHLAQQRVDSALLNMVAFGMTGE